MLFCDKDDKQVVWIMKKQIALLIVIVMAVTIVSFSLAEEQIQTVEFAMSFFEGVWGNVLFRLPGNPERINEADMTDDEGNSLWTDNWQLMGGCVDDGAEYQLHMADIGNLVQKMQVLYPEESETDCRLQALMNYGMFMPKTYGAKMKDVIPHKTGDNLWMTVEFVYEDTPDLSYIGHFMLSGSKAACLIMACCDHADQVKEAMRFITDEEKDAWLAKKQRPIFRNLNGLLMTFPAKPEHIDMGNSESLACFTANCGLIQVQFIPQTIKLGTTDAEKQESMEYIAREKMLSPYMSEALNPVYSCPAEHTAQLDFSFINGTSMGEYGQKMLGRLYVSEYGIWYVYVPDDNTGQAFLDSILLGR